MTSNTQTFSRFERANHHETVNQSPEMKSTKMPSIKTVATCSTNAERQQLSRSEAVKEAMRRTG